MSMATKEVLGRYVTQGVGRRRLLERPGGRARPSIEPAPQRRRHQIIQNCSLAPRWATFFHA